MKQSRIVMGLFALMIAFTLSNCKDDDDGGPSKTSLLTAKSWKVTDEKISGVSVYDDYYDDCDKDDLVKFGTDGKITYDEGTTKCDSSSPQTSAGGTWAFESNETKLKITDPSGDSESYDIKELTSTSFKVSQSYTSSGTTYTYEIYFTAI